MLNKMIILEGIPGSGKSTLARFIAIQMERNGYDAKLYHETTGDHPLFISNNNLSIEDWMDSYIKNWKQLINTQEESGYSIVLESALFQYPILNLLHKDIQREVILEYINQIINVIYQKQPILLYLYQDDQETAIRKMLDIRGGESFLSEKYNRFKNEPYYINRGNTDPSLHIQFMLDYGQLANKAFEMSELDKYAIENSNNEWEFYKSQLLKFLKLSFYDDPAIESDNLKEYTGTYRNNSMNFNIVIQLHGEQLVIFDNKKLHPKGSNLFYIDDISANVTFIQDVSGVVSGLIIGEKDIYVNMKDEGTDFIKIA